MAGLLAQKRPPLEMVARPRAASAAGRISRSPRENVDAAITDHGVFDARTDVPPGFFVSSPLFAPRALCRRCPDHSITVDLVQGGLQAHEAMPSRVDPVDAVDVPERRLAAKA